MRSWPGEMQIRWVPWRPMSKKSGGTCESRPCSLLRLSRLVVHILLGFTVTIMDVLVPRAHRRGQGRLSRGHRWPADFGWWRLSRR